MRYRDRYTLLFVSLSLSLSLFSQRLAFRIVAYCVPNRQQFQRRVREEKMRDVVGKKCVSFLLFIIDSDTSS